MSEQANSRYSSPRGMDLLARLESLPVEKRDELYAIIERMLVGDSLHESSRVTAGPDSHGNYPDFCVNRTSDPYNPVRIMLKRWGFDPDHTTPILALLIREKMREVDVIIERHAQHGESVFNPIGILGTDDPVKAVGLQWDAKVTRLRDGDPDPMRKQDTSLDVSCYGTIWRCAVILSKTRVAPLFEGKE